MPLPFEYPLLGWLNQHYAAPDGYAALFNGAAPEIMGESPYVNGREAGIAFALDKMDAVRAIFLYADGVEAFRQYQGALPAGLSFTSTRTEVCAGMGNAPSFSGQAGGEGIFAIDHSFDRFEEGAFYIRFEYLPDDQGVRLVTMGLA